MNTINAEDQLRSILSEFYSLQSKSRSSDLSDLPRENRQAVVTRAIAAIYRITSKNSTYVQEVNRLLQSMPAIHEHIKSVIGVTEALLDDVRAGYVLSVVELAHADVFGDFLEMAQHLCDTKYKDASAVIAGSALEAHLRNLCQKTGIPVQTTKPNGDVVPKKADGMNSDLAASTVYSKLDQKNETAWLDLRNKAAHGLYNEYTQEQVAILVTSIRDFITRYPA